MIQSVFSIPALDQPVTCKLCGMSYRRSSESDQALHKKYHFTFIHGPSFDVTCHAPLETSRLLFDKKSVECKIYVVQRDLPKMIRKAESVLQMVNRELNAPPENPAWKSRRTCAFEGKAFMVVIEKRVVGLCATEPITNIESQTRWMVHRTQEIVPQQINQNSKLGISRIWVAPHWRRRGLGVMMLNAVMKYLEYGITLKKKDLAFSQPSYSGGLLAKTFCGVKHKSGEILVPIYLEDA
ncbi:hypothetical protein METBIDRAFT_45184 [Metschnikowia bicuspidata var. bicuspidata NRRL YB-4993]|uniref:N-acetyltransferase ECO1 n=1 Tax=Metschnikowia bicuspidata var. bicuspidata NRRL YB-4993 TaxID=869754 RepID=A0A1A0H7P4_9ASCO|nr:hypothetical protein METBIDRAFT_45184 [Metschnikowia bicuspidata var. bicuspidata NRRL YB-4993]OBA20119.1 hypothetical protein METBIDRAFT_45184 [Metschnikowia bicuspidata var. bicuspidata NRRL YB-4993]